jgi:hypothetical protein
MAARTTKSRRTTKKADPEPEDLEDDDLDAELDDEEDEEPAPKKRAAKKAPAKKAAAKKEKEEVLGSAWLKEHVNDTLGTEHESTKLRIVLRKLIKDGTIDSPKDGRYIFAGPRDPNVKAVIAALRKEAKAGPAKRGRKAKAKVAAEVDDDDTEVEDLDLDDDE